MASRLSSFLAELKRRKVYRVAGAYVIVGAVLAGAANDILPRLGLPEWTVSFVVVLLLLGFPLAVALAWAYEVKPEEPREAEKASPPVIAPSYSERKSIVVLPFDNMSPDPGDAYFADGLTEEIISKLSHIRSLRVISRSSAMVLKGTQKDVRTIGKDLDVQYVLEGSVRKAGSDLRITAQLIDADRDSHLWAENYEGVLEDVFGMQEDVSHSIVEALRLEIGPKEAERISERPIRDTRAYECYLKAQRDFLMGTEASLDRAHALLDTGLEILGENDLLYTAKAETQFQVVNAMLASPQDYEKLLKEAEGWARRAIELNPDSDGAYGALGLIYSSMGRPSDSIRHFERALELDSQWWSVLLMGGYWRAVVGWDVEGARELLEKLARVDPLTPMNKGALAWLHWFAGDFEAVLDAWQDWRERPETLSSPYVVLHAYFQAGAGNVDEAVRLVGFAEREHPGHIMTKLGTFLKYSWLSEREKALKSIGRELVEGTWWDDMWSLLMTSGFSSLGENDEACRWLEHTIDYGICNATYLRGHDPFLAGLRSDSRFQGLMEKAEGLSVSLRDSFGH